MKVIQIKGANGSGKTTIMKQLIATSYDLALLRDTVNYKVIATVLKDLRWIVIGKYDIESKMGGCDNMPTVNSVKLAIQKCIRKYPDYHGIIFEGMMISTIKTTFYDHLLHLEQLYGIEPLFVILDTTTEKCVERIQGRGTMKPGLKIDNIATSVATVHRHALTYDQKYVRWISVDNVTENQMLEEFFKQV